jgi:hypothetical protein
MRFISEMSSHRYFKQEPGVAHPQPSTHSGLKPYLVNLNKEQTEAVEADWNPVLIIAPAGSGTHLS